MFTQTVTVRRHFTANEKMILHIFLTEGYEWYLLVLVVMDCSVASSFLAHVGLSGFHLGIKRSYLQCNFS